MISYWKPVLVLLKVRYRAAANGFAENPSAVVGRAMLAAIIGVAALSRSNSLGRQWPDMATGAAQAALSRMWVETQFFWILALLVPGVVTLLGRGPQRETLRAFALRPSQTLFADFLTGLIDLPTIVAAIALLPLLWRLCEQGELPAAAAALIVFTLLALQTVALARLLVMAGSLVQRRLRRWAEVPAITALMLVGLCVCVPPAFASIITAPPQNPNAIHIRLPSPPAVDPSPLLPTTYASGTVTAVRAHNPLRAGGSLGALAALTFGTLGGAVILNRRESRIHAVAAASKPRFAIRPAGAGITLRAGPASQLLALVTTDLRMLLRNPGAYLPLRRPAAIVLLGILGFLAPDMGKDPVYSLKELLGLGGVIYTVIWQVQLLCNRFGTEYGSAAMLFSLSVPRALLVVGKNLSLLLLLLTLDSACMAGLLVVAEAPANIPTFLFWMALALVVLTALGNLLSVAFPFAIAKSDSESKGDTPEGLAFGYACVGGATWLLLLPAAALFSRGLLFGFAAWLFLAALYGLSLWVVTVQTKKHERRMIALLDRNGQ